jgi:hypothetical protein
VRDPVGQLLNELKEAAAVAAIVGANPTMEPRVRSPKPGPGDSQAAAAYRAFIVIATLATPPEKSAVPVMRARHVVRCYGRNPTEAELLYDAASEALHHRGPRQQGTRAIYASHDDTGAAYEEDPDTKQPLYSFIVETLAATQAVAQ